MKNDVIAKSMKAFETWRTVPAPVRGQFVQSIGDQIRSHKEELAGEIVRETKKIMSEAMGEVQEAIDMADFAVGLSRQLHGLTIASERPRHRMMEQWHPLGPVGVITAFNFPMAVWAWNAMLALVCGDSVIWKPSEKTEGCTRALMALCDGVMFPSIPKNILSVMYGGPDVAMSLAADKRVPLISATGSTKMGRSIGPVVAARMGRSILELGGNNAMIVMPSADTVLAIRAIVFSAVGTCGQRCTTLRRLFVHKNIYAKVVRDLAQVYKSLSIGDPWDDDNLVGPIIDKGALVRMQKAILQAESEGGKVLTGGEELFGLGAKGDHYVRPAIIEMPSQTRVMQSETFAPILYVVPIESLDEGIAMNNDVPQGLSSAVFTNDIREAERFMSAAGSDCGIVNVNIGTSGAEIGGAFGGEKESGGGRESGSDAWKAYMRRATNTVNFSSELPLAQGVRFG